MALRPGLHRAGQPHDIAVDGDVDAVRVELGIAADGLANALLRVGRRRTLRQSDQIRQGEDAAQIARFANDGSDLGPSARARHVQTIHE